VRPEVKVKWLEGLLEFDFELRVVRVKRGMGRRVGRKS